MKKIVFCDIPMQSGIEKSNYTGSNGKTYEDKVRYAVNLFVKEEAEDGDEIKVVLLKKQAISGNSDVNEEQFKAEFDDLLFDKLVDIEYKTLTTPFEETRLVHEQLLRDIIDEFENGAQVYVDITFGPKPLPIIMFTALNFAEKYYNCDIKSIIYGKVDFVKDEKTGKSKATNPVIYDVTPLYYLNSGINTIPYNTIDF